MNYPSPVPTPTWRYLVNVALLYKKICCYFINCCAYVRKDTFLVDYLKIDDILEDKT
jgi:hypothetical protein